MIDNCSMWEIGFVVYIRKSLFKYVTNVKVLVMNRGFNCVQSDTKPTGFANIVGNKGGVGISFKILDTSLCFINSHLPARAERITNRNQDYQGLTEGLSLGHSKLDIFSQFDQLYWIGDLNYRLDQQQREKIYAHLQFNNYEALLAHDQLRYLFFYMTLCHDIYAEKRWTHIKCFLTLKKEESTFLPE